MQACIENFAHCTENGVSIESRDHQDCWILSFNHPRLDIRHLQHLRLFVSSRSGRLVQGRALVNYNQPRLKLVTAE
ncbi:hypothetical protein CEXT_56131 [Caerostris extrusa]|uniref:Uncharacterized protein n=1 Tax=Caerostris extrusa TaxID=172846 RepID=A0AAV4NA04_CAEEX|nr:hypothetical protein CEXT_56131 [Caerostris extrusa]